MRVVIAGLGLIGGSMGQALGRQLNVEVRGIESNPDHKVKALELGLVSQMVDWDEAMLWADIIVLAIPVDAIEIELGVLLEKVGPHQTIIDLGSTKGSMIQRWKDHRNRGRWVAAHPLAGTEYSGPQAAVKALFEGKKNIICGAENTDADALETAYALFRSVGLDTFEMDAFDHDKHLAYVSHLSHVSSFMLGLAVLKKEKDEHSILQLAGTGFASTVRLAKSQPATWLPIFMTNREAVLEAIDTYVASLQEFRHALEYEDEQSLFGLMMEANGIKKIL